MVGQVQFSFQIFNAGRQLSHIEAAPGRANMKFLVMYETLGTAVPCFHETGLGI